MDEHHGEGLAVGLWLHWWIRVLLEGHEQAQMKQNEEGLLQLMDHKVFQVLFHHVMLQELGIGEGDEAVGALWNSYVAWNPLIPPNGILLLSVLRAGYI